MNPIDTKIPPADEDTAIFPVSDSRSFGGTVPKRNAQVIVFHSHGVGQLIQLSHFPENGETLWSSSWEIGSDGAKGSNTAAALERLGVPTAFVSKIGADIWGRIGEDLLEKNGVSCEALIRDSSMTTQIGAVLVDRSGSNSILLGGEAACFSAEEIQHSIDRYPEANYLITGFEIRISDALKAASYAKNQGKYVILNPSPAPDRDIGRLDFVDLLVVNETERDALLALKNCRTIDSKKEDGSANKQYDIQSIQRLQELYGCAHIILTLGGDGCLLLDKGQISFFPAQSVPVTDTSGAGDSFLAAVTAALVHGLPLSKGCELATLYAAQTVQKWGTFPAFASLEEMNALYPEMFSLLKA